jgi:hypothetical protein
MTHYNLFGDEKIKSVFNSLPKEEQENYKRQGEYMYAKDYENAGNPEEKILESVAYISEGLKSGLRPSQLDASELELMRSTFGNMWYEKFGYASEKQ